MQGRNEIQPLFLQNPQGAAAEVRRFVGECRKNPDIAPCLFRPPSGTIEKNPLSNPVGQHRKGTRPYEAYLCTPDGPKPDPAALPLRLRRQPERRPYSGGRRGPARPGLLHIPGRNHYGAPSGRCRGAGLRGGLGPGNPHGVHHSPLCVRGAPVFRPGGPGPGPRRGGQRRGVRRRQGEGSEPCHRLPGGRAPGGGRRHRPHDPDRRQLRGSLRPHCPGQRTKGGSLCQRPLQRQRGARRRHRHLHLLPQPGHQRLASGPAAPPDHARGHRGGGLWHGGAA